MAPLWWWRLRKTGETGKDQEGPGPSPAAGEARSSPGPWREHAACRPALRPRPGPAINVCCGSCPVWAAPGTHRHSPGARAGRWAGPSRTAQAWAERRTPRRPHLQSPRPGRRTPVQVAFAPRHPSWGPCCVPFPCCGAQGVESSKACGRRSRGQEGRASCPNTECLCPPTRAPSAQRSLGVPLHSRG